MNTLEQVMEFLTERAVELEAEGLNSGEYWVAHAGLDDGETREFIYAQSVLTLEVGAAYNLSVLDVVAASMLTGFNLGYALAKREELISDGA